MLSVNPSLVLFAHSYRRPRKISGVLVPHGYKFINGKIEHDGVAKDHDQSENAEKAPPKTPTKTTKKAPKTPKSKEPKAPKVNKKRKLDEEEEEAENDDVVMVKGEDDEAVESGVKADDGVKEASRQEEGEQD